MYEWLEAEICEIKTPNFHVVEDHGADINQQKSKEIVSPLPPSYLTFISKFGGAKLYRRSNYYEVGVLNPPQEKLLDDGEKILLVGHFDDAEACFICSRLMSDQESPVYEWTEEGLEEVADNFEEWLTSRCTEARESYDNQEWENILGGSKPFTDQEKAIIKAREQFQWQVVEFNENRSIKVLVRNNSDLVLPYLTIGMRTRKTGQASQVWESGIHLDVSNIQPGQESVVEHSIHQSVFTPDNTEFFDQVNLIPEDRQQYWEFRSE